MDVWAIRITIEKAASNLFKLISPEAGFHSRRSQSWIKRYVLTKVKPMESNEMRSHTIQWNWIVGLKAIGWPEYSHCNWFIFPPLPATPTIQFSLDHKLWSHEGNRKYMNSSDFSDTDSGQLMIPFTTAIFTLSMALFRLRLWVRLWCKPPWTW